MSTNGNGSRKGNPFFGCVVITALLLFFTVVHHGSNTAELRVRSRLISDPLHTSAGEGMYFLSVGDWGGETEKAFLIAQQMADYSKALHPKFILSTGDQFYPDGVTSLEDPQFKIFDKLFDRDGLREVPWWLSFGQHDLRGNITAQLLYQDKHKRWNFPARFYTSPTFWTGKDRAGASLQFFVIDSYSKDILTTQRDFLKRELEGSRADWKFVVGHQPIFTSSGMNRDNEKAHWTEKRLVDGFAPLFGDNRVQAYLCGDNHFLEVLQDNEHGTAHFVNGGGYGSDHPVYDLAADEPKSVWGKVSAGFALHHLSKTDFRTWFINEKGEVLYHYSVPFDTKGAPKGTAFVESDVGVVTGLVK